MNNTDIIITAGLLCAYGLAIAAIIFTYNKVKAFNKRGRERVRRLERAGRL